MTTDPACRLDAEQPEHRERPERCVTCGDEGIPMDVIELGDGVAVCADEERARHRIATDLVEPVAVGDTLIVHAGVAIAQLSGSRR